MPKGIYPPMDFAVPADYKVKVKLGKKFEKFLDFFLKTKES